MTDASIVEDWLKSLHLGHYAESFVDNGYDDLEICKQIGEPDLDAIGVNNAQHRADILKAVRVLLEEGGTAVYFTLEEQEQFLRNAGLFGRHADDFDDLPAVVTGQAVPPYAFERKSGKCEGSGVSPGRPFVDEYEEGKAEFVRLPKLQLKVFIRDKLIRDGIRLSAFPYTNPDGSRGHLESLAARYSEEINTHFQDVLDRLEDLRRRRVAIDIPQPLEDPYGTLNASQPFRPGKYQPSSCLTDNEEESVYGATSTNPATQVSPERCLSPRSQYFYEPCPFNTAGGKENGEQSKKKSGLGRIFRTLAASRKSSPKHKSGKPPYSCFTLRSSHESGCRPLQHLQISEPFLCEDEKIQLMRMVRDGYLTMEEAVQRIKQKHYDRCKTLKSTEVISDLGKSTIWTPSPEKKTPSKPTSIFYSDVPAVDGVVDTAAAAEEQRRRVFSHDEFTSAILARTQAVTLGGKLSSPGSSPIPCNGQCGNIMCSVTADDAASSLPSAAHGKTQKPHILHLNRSSYSTSEEGHSLSSDEEGDKRMELARDPVVRSSSSLAGKVRDLHRDVKRRISRLRSSRTASESEARDHSDGAIQTASSVESIPSGSGSSVQAHTPTSSNRSSSSVGDDDSHPVLGPIVGRARALVDYTPSPYDRDALGFKKGDIIDIVTKNNTGTWIGVADGKVGHFKFINVEELPLETRSRHRRRNSDGPSVNKPKDLEQLLQQSGLESCLNVLMLHGYEDLETFKNIDGDDLKSLGIIDPTLQQKVLCAAEQLLDDDEIREEAISTVINYVPLPSDSSSQAEATPANNLDAFSEPDFTAVPKQPYNSSAETPQFLPNIPAVEPRDESPVVALPNDNGGHPQSHETLYPEEDSSESTLSLLRTTAEILKASSSSDYDSEFSAPYFGCTGVAILNGIQEHRVRGKVPPPIPKRTTACAYHTPNFTNGSSSCRSDDVANARHVSLPRKKTSQDAEDVTCERPNKNLLYGRIAEKKLYKKFGQRKGSLQQTTKAPRPPSMTLLSAITRKLEDEGIDLSWEPYTDKTGFCGIPPALVQRYAEELQRDIYDVAEAVDQARINVLQIRGRRGVPNDFLADACYGPVVEANYQSLRDWLVSLGLPMYEDSLAGAGFLFLDKVALLRDNDFRECGICNPRHVRLLTAAVGALNIHLARMEAC